MSQSADPTALDAVLAPMSRAAFLADHWNKRFCHVAGSPGRFVPLFDWQMLNDLLEQGRYDPPRLRLVQNGEAVAVERYFSSSGEDRRLDAGGLVACLSQGATLVFNGVDALTPSVGALADAFQETLLAATTVNLYAGWRRQRGFDLHWDRQDTMILQVSGRKRWRVHRPTLDAPLAGDTPSAPTGAPEWEGVLEDGAMLYLPRGWWHVAEPLDEPSLHLTVTMVPARGTDLLDWVMARLRGRVEARMDLPRLADAATRARHLSGLRAALIESFDDAAFDDFLRHWDARHPARPRLDLPGAVRRQSMPPAPETRLRLGGLRLLAIESGEGGLAHFLARGSRWTCAADLAPILADLSDRRPRRFGDLLARAPAGRAAELRRLMTALLMAGVVMRDD